MSDSKFPRSKGGDIAQNISRRKSGFRSCRKHANGKKLRRKKEIDPGLFWARVPGSGFCLFFCFGWGYRQLREFLSAKDGYVDVSSDGLVVE